MQIVGISLNELIENYSCPIFDLEDDEIEFF